MVRDALVGSKQVFIVHFIQRFPGFDSSEEAGLGQVGGGVVCAWQVRPMVRRCQAGSWSDTLSPLKHPLFLAGGCVPLLWGCKGSSCFDVSFLGAINRQGSEEDFVGGWWGGSNCEASSCVVLQGPCAGAIALGQALLDASISSCWADLALFLGKHVLS